MDYERRKTLEEIREDVRRINEKYKTSRGAKANTAGIQKAEDGGDAANEAN